MILVIPPSHRRRGATAVLIRHKLQWHRHDRRGSTVVPSLIVVAPRKTVKTADLRGGTAATFNMFRRASAVLVPSHLEAFYQTVLGTMPSPVICYSVNGALVAEVASTCGLGHNTLCVKKIKSIKSKSF